MRRTPLLQKLRTVDFAEVAKQGCFVYCYLRADGSPYYVGIASTAARLFQKHTCAVPTRGSNRIRVMRSGLTWDQAARWEILYISRYGRKDLGIGILRNLTDGGEGTLGRKVHASSRAKMSAAMKGRTFSAEHRAKISAAKQDMSAEQRAKISAANQGRVLSAETRARMSAARKGRAFSEEHLAKIKAAKQGRGAEIGAKISAAKAAQRAFTAKKFGISPEIYEKLTPAQRKTLGNRHRRGKRGAALLEGLL